MVHGYLAAVDANDIPDALIWHHPRRLEEWFKAVEQRHKHGYESVPDADEEEGMTSNTLARELIGD